MVDGGHFQKIICIICDIDCMVTKIAFFERLPVDIENPNLVFHLNVVLSGVRADLKLQMMNIVKMND